MGPCCGPVDRWTGGSVDLWALGNVALQHCRLNKVKDDYYGLSPRRSKEFFTYYGILSSLVTPHDEI